MPCKREANINDNCLCDCQYCDYVLCELNEKEE